jgi:hypothetical protein
VDTYLDRDARRALDLDEATIERLLRDTPHSGHDRRPVVSAQQLPDLLGLLVREEDGLP